ncbi:MAG: hypothetical protein ACLVL2_21500 [Bacteroides cellulosilyticus]
MSWFYNQFGVGGTVDTPAVFFEDKCQVVYIECAPQYGTGMEVVTFFQVVVLEADTPFYTFLVFSHNDGKVLFREVKVGNACESMMVVAVKVCERVRKKFIYALI